MGRLWLNNELVDRLAMLQQTETVHPGINQVAIEKDKGTNKIWESHSFWRNISRKRAFFPLYGSDYRQSAGAAMCIVRLSKREIVALFIASLPLLVWGIIFISAAAGDIWMTWLLTKEDPKNMVLDHPTEAGFYIIEEEALAGQHWCSAVHCGLILDSPFPIRPCFLMLPLTSQGSSKRRTVSYCQHVLMFPLTTQGTSKETYCRKSKFISVCPLMTQGTSKRKCRFVQKNIRFLTTQLHGIFHIWLDISALA